MADEVEVNGEVTDANWNDIKGTAAPKMEAAEKVVSPDDELAKIKLDLVDRDAKIKAAQETAAAEYRARVAAEQRAAEREQDVTRLRSEAATAQTATVESTILALQHEQANAKAVLRAAMEAADYEKAAEAQAVLSTVSARIVGQEMMKNEPRLRNDPVSVASYTQPTRTNDPVEGFLSGFSPSSQVWLRQHRDSIQNDGGRMKLSPQVMSAHYGAQANNLAVDSPEYFQFIEQQIAPEPVDDGGVEIEPQTPAAIAASPLRRAAPVSAPVSRETPSRTAQASDPKRIRLTAEQAEAASISGMSPLDYYNNLQTLKAEGKIGRVTH